MNKGHQGNFHTEILLGNCPWLTIFSILGLASSYPERRIVTLPNVDFSSPHEVNNLEPSSIPEIERRSITNNSNYFEATVGEVENILKSNPDLPRLTRGEILDLLENVTKEDMDRLKNLNVNRNGKAILLVMPYSPKKDGENMEELYTKQPVTQLIDTANTESETKKTTRRKKPTPSMKKESTTVKAETKTVPPTTSTTESTPVYTSEISTIPTTVKITTYRPRTRPPRTRPPTTTRVTRRRRTTTIPTKTTTQVQSEGDPKAKTDKFLPENAIRVTKPPIYRFSRRTTTVKPDLTAAESYVNNVYVKYEPSKSEMNQLDKINSNLNTIHANYEPNIDDSQEDVKFTTKPNPVFKPLSAQVVNVDENIKTPERVITKKPLTEDIMIPENLKYILKDLQLDANSNDRKILENAIKSITMSSTTSTTTTEFPVNPLPEFEEVADNLNPDMRNLLMSFGLIPNPDGDKVREETGLVFYPEKPEERRESYIRFKPLPAEGATDKEMDALLASFGLGRNAREGKKSSMKLDESMDLSFIPNSMLGIVQNLGLDRVSLTGDNKERNKVSTEKVTNIDRIGELGDNDTISSEDINDINDLYNNEIDKNTDNESTGDLMNESATNGTESFIPVNTTKTDEKIVQIFPEKLTRNGLDSNVTKNFLEGLELTSELEDSNSSSSLKNTTEGFHSEASAKNTSTSVVFNPTDQKIAQEEKNQLNKLIELMQTLKKINGSASQDFKNVDSATLQQLTEVLNNSQRLTLGEQIADGLDPLDSNQIIVQSKSKRQETTTAMSIEVNTSPSKEATTKSDAQLLAEAFADLPMEEITEAPTTQKIPSGVYYLIDWNTFFEVDDSKGRHVNLRFQPTVEFILKNVSLDENFTTNITSNIWRSINLGKESYAVGISEDKILVLKATQNKTSTKFLMDSFQTNISRSYVDVLLLKIQKRKNEPKEIIMIAVSSDGTLDWFTVVDLKIFWTWNTEYKIEHSKIGFNTALGRHQLFLSTEEYLNVYHFELIEQKIWLEETIRLSKPIGSFDTAMYRGRFYLLVPQKSTENLFVFQYVDSHFEHFVNVSSPEIDQVVVFEEDFKTFFAIDGQRAGIYQIEKRSRILKKRIVNSHSEGIEYWLPVTTSNVNQNLILFGQRVLEHGSHKSRVIETFIYNGEDFEEHEDIRCLVFGEIFNSLSCWSNSENSVGIEGAAPISVGDTLGILLSKRKPHNLFIVNFEMKVLESPVNKEIRRLNDTKNRLQELLHKKLEQFKLDGTNSVPSKVTSEKPVHSENMRNSAYHERNIPETENLQKEPVLGTRNKIELSEKLDQILVKLKELKDKMDHVELIEKSGKFKKIIVNGPAKIKNASVKKIVTTNINHNPAGNLMEDIVRKDKEKIVGGTKTFADIMVENLNFQSVDGIESSDILFKASELITVKGDVSFEKPVTILRNINTEFIDDMPSSSLIDMKIHIPGTLSFENIDVKEIQTGELNKLPIPQTWVGHVEHSENLIEDDTVFIPHNVTVERINGDNFQQLLKELCLVNIETHLPEDITIHGDIFVEQLAYTKYLNTIKYPESYFFVDSLIPGASISGKKTFLNTLKGKEVRIKDKYMNGIKTTDYLTLSTEQDISGKTTFTNLEITGNFKHDGKFIGDKKFLPNPTMLETKIIKSNVNFDKLEVTGSITVEEDLNNMNYKEVLEDIVYKDEEKPIIYSMKEFPEGLTVKKNLNITSNSINMIPLEQIVTTNTNQVLYIAQLNGNVSIETMDANQFIDGINITKLEQECVKTSGEQFISSVLIFEENLETNRLEIANKLNDIPVEKFLSITGNRTLNHNTTFDEVETGYIRITDNFVGKIRGIDLNHFFNNRLSYNTPQNITEPFEVGYSQLKTIKCEKLKATSCNMVFDEGHIMRTVFNKVESGELRVKDLIVNENFTVQRMVGIPLDVRQELTGKTIILKGDAHFSNLQISQLSDVNFKKFLHNTIFKNETDVTIHSTKLFKNGFLVQKLIETNEINSIPIDALLNNEEDQTIVSPIEIVGNVTLKANVFIETMNDVLVEEVKRYFGKDEDIYVLKGDVMFDRLTKIQNLEVLGHLNEEEIHELIKNIAYKGVRLNFGEEIQFYGNVTIENDLEIHDNLNDVNLSDLNDNIVYLNKPETEVIESGVTFSESYIFANSLIVDSNLVTNYMFGMDLESWKENLVYVNKGFLQGVYRFENVTIHDNLTTNCINNLYMNKTIKLGSNEDISNLSIKDVVFLKNVPVGKMVNGFNLQEEYINSVMSNKEQEILSELCIRNSTLIRNNLVVAGLLNNYTLNEIVRTDTYQNLSAIFKFPVKSILDSNLYVNGTVNSINMTVWENGVIKMVSNETQEIEAPWHVKGNLTFVEPLSGECSIYSFDTEKVIGAIKDQETMNKALQLEYMEDHKQICGDLSFLSKALKKQIYRLEAFESFQVIEYPRKIRKTHFFLGAKPTLLLNGVGSCESDIYTFDNDVFVRKNKIQMGEIDQIVTVFDKEVTYFIVKTIQNSKCDTEETTAWIYQNNTVQKIQTIENQQLLQESLVPSTFYGLNKFGVTEFRIDTTQAIPVYAYRKWKLHEDNMAFVPRRLSTGLAMRTGEKLIRLLRKDQILHNEIHFTNIRGKMEITENHVLPGRNNNKIEVIKVGPKAMRKSLLAVILDEEPVIASNLNTIKIYESYSSNKVFQTIFSQKASSLLSVEFTNGETFLFVLEEHGNLQIFEYKGIEGFKLRSSTEIQGSHMFKVNLPLGSNDHIWQAVAVINGDQVNIIRPIMLGSPTNEMFEC
ncbi:hypothetical protein HHI36_011177 [Cryptolaemus montrouzieri]|uniref:Uncharacterized protein n=1 Tax=Cryptolaemus montrouzieri TaxID=559131 RepID=A0ABD2ML19_9CUCU